MILKSIALPIVAIVCLYACKPKNSDYQIPDSKTTEDAVADTLKRQSLEVKTFAAQEGTFGYEIWIDGKKIIYQATIPGVPGIQGFATEDSAQKVGELVADKIRKNQMPPTVTPEELDSLGVLH